MTHHTSERIVRLLVDRSTLRPACVLLQAVAGGDADVVGSIDPSQWVLAPTPDMFMLTGTVAQFDQYVDRMNSRPMPGQRWKPGER